MKLTRQTAPVNACSGGTSNALDFLPLDRSGNRRFIPGHGVPGASRGSHFGGRSRFQSLYQPDVGGSNGDLPKRHVQAVIQPSHAAVSQRTPAGFLCRRTPKAGMIQAYLDKYTGETVCSKQLYKEALNHTFDEPKQWENPGNQRDNEPVHYRVELLFQSEDVCGIRQTKGLGA